MSCLLLALVTHFTIYRRATRPGQAAENSQPVSRCYCGQASFLEDEPSRSLKLSHVSIHVLSMDENHLAQHRDSRRALYYPILGAFICRYRMVRRHGPDGDLRYSESAYMSPLRTSYLNFALEVAGFAIMLVSGGLLWWCEARCLLQECQLSQQIGAAGAGCLNALVFRKASRPPDWHACRCCSGLG